MEFEPVVLSDGTPIPAHGYLLCRLTLAPEELRALAAGLEELCRDGGAIHLQDVDGDERRGFYGELVIERKEKS